MNAPRDKSISFQNYTKAGKRKPSLDIVRFGIKKTVFKLRRFEGNPIISPRPENDWESFVTTNPGVWYDKDAGKVSLLYRAAGNDDRHVIHFGLAESYDGYHFQRYDEPNFSPSKDGLDGGCIEDPRIVKMGQYYYIKLCNQSFLAW
jgi:beta-1,2-mannobiose phosphorylase / 1,2-beta-oligomannan phosphorylase